MANIELIGQGDYDAPVIRVSVAGRVTDNDGIVTEMAVTGSYWGGHYIELFEPWDDDPNAGPFDVINVYDHESGKPRIGFTVDDVTRCLNEYLRERLEEEVRGE